MSLKLIPALALTLLTALTARAQFQEMTVREVRQQIQSEISNLKVVLCDRDLPSPQSKLELVVQLQRATKAARCDLVRSLKVEMDQVFDLKSAEVEQASNLAELLHERYLKVTRKFVRDFFDAEKKLVDQAFQKPDLTKEEKNALFFQFDVARERNIQIMNDRLVLLGEFIRQLDQIKIKQEVSISRSQVDMSVRSNHSSSPAVGAN